MRLDSSRSKYFERNNYTYLHLFYKNNVLELELLKKIEDRWVNRER